MGRAPQEASSRHRVLPTFLRREGKASSDPKSGRARRVLAVAGAAVLFGPALAATMGNTGESGNGSGGGGGNVSSIYIEGYKVPDDFVGPIMDASRVCSGTITPQILTGLTYYESSFNDFDKNNNNQKEVSSAGAEGPTQWMPKYWPGGDIWSIQDSEMNTARRLCHDARSLGVWGAVQNYNPKQGDYSAIVKNYADQVVIHYDSGGGGSHKHTHLSTRQKAAELKNAGYSHVSAHGNEGRGTFGRGCPTVIFTMRPEGGFSVRGIVTNESNKVRWPGNANPSAQEMRGLDGRLCH